MSRIVSVRVLAHFLAVLSFLSFIEDVTSAVLPKSQTDIEDFYLLCLDANYTKIAQSNSAKCYLFVRTFRPFNFGEASNYCAQIGQDGQNTYLALLKRSEEVTAIRQVLSAQKWEDVLVGVRRVKGPMRWLLPGSQNRQKQVLSRQGCLTSMAENSGIVIESVTIQECRINCFILGYTFALVRQHPTDPNRLSRCGCAGDGDIDWDSRVANCSWTLESCSVYNCSARTLLTFILRADDSQQTYDENWAIDLRNNTRTVLRRRCVSASLNTNRTLVIAEENCTRSLPSICLLRQRANAVCEETSCLLRVNDRALQFVEAWKACTLILGNSSAGLSSILSSDEASGIAGLIRNSTLTNGTFWLGATDLDFSWQDGSRLLDKATVDLEFSLRLQTNELLSIDDNLEDHCLAIIPNNSNNATFFERRSCASPTPNAVTFICGGEGLGSLTLPPRAARTTTMAAATANNSDGIIAVAANQAQVSSQKDTKSDDGDDSRLAGAIVGAVIGGIVGGALVALLIVCCVGRSVVRKVVDSNKVAPVEKVEAFVQVERPPSPLPPPQLPPPPIFVRILFDSDTDKIRAIKFRRAVEVPPRTDLLVCGKLDGTTYLPDSIQAIVVIARHTLIRPDESEWPTEGGLVFTIGGDLSQGDAVVSIMNVGKEVVGVKQGEQIDVFEKYRRVSLATVEGFTLGPSLPFSPILAPEQSPRKREVVAPPPPPPPPPPSEPAQPQSTCCHHCFEQPVAPVALVAPPRVQEPKPEPDFDAAIEIKADRLNTDTCHVRAAKDFTIRAGDEILVEGVMDPLEFDDIAGVQGIVCIQPRINDANFLFSNAIAVSDHGRISVSIQNMGDQPVTIIRGETIAIVERHSRVNLVRRLAKAPKAEGNLEPSHSNRRPANAWGTEPFLLLLKGDRGLRGKSGKKGGPCECVCCKKEHQPAILKRSRSFNNFKHIEGSAYCLHLFENYKDRHLTPELARRSKTPISSRSIKN